MNRKFIVLCLYMIVCAFSGLIFFLSPLSLARANNKSFVLSLVYCGDEKKNFGGQIMIFDPAQGKYRLMKVNKINLSGSIYNRAYELRRRIEGVDPSREDFFYACIDQNVSLETLSSFLGSWRDEPRKLLSFTFSFVKIFSGLRSNLNLADTLSVYFEILRSKPLDFSYIEVDDIKDQAKDEREDEKVLSKKIRIRFTDASGKKSNIEKTLSFLREKGFDVIDSRRVKSRKKTEIISYNSNTLAARKLAVDLGIKNSAVIVKKEKYNIYEAEIIAGEDFVFIK